MARIIVPAASAWLAEYQRTAGPSTLDKPTAAMTASPRAGWPVSRATR